MALTPGVKLPDVGPPRVACQLVNSVNNNNNNNNSVALLAQDCHKTSCLSTMADRCERFFLFSSESERSDDSSGGPVWNAPAVYAVPAPAVDLAPAPAVYAVPAPVVEYIAPAPAVPVVEYIAPTPAVPVMEYIAPAPAVPVMKYIAPAPAVPVMKYIAPAPAVLFVEYIAPAPAVYAAPAPVVEDIASALVSPPTLVVEFIGSVPTSTPAVSSPPATSVQSRQSALRVSMDVPTMSSRHHHDELFRAERVLEARAARQGYLQANEEKGHAAGSSAYQPWESV